MPYIQAEVIWAVRNEMARTVEDVLARRLRVLFLNAMVAIEMAPKVASLMARELNLEIGWEVEQIKLFTELAKRYLLKSYTIDHTESILKIQNPDLNTIN